MNVCLFCKSNIKKKEQVRVHHPLLLLPLIEQFDGEKWAHKHCLDYALYDKIEEIRLSMSTIYHCCGIKTNSDFINTPDPKRLERVKVAIDDLYHKNGWDIVHISEATGVTEEWIEQYIKSKGK